VNLLADSVIFELAGSRVAASVASAARRPTTVAVLAFLNNAVSALLLGNDRNTSIGAQTRGVHASYPESSANISDGASVVHQSGR